MPESARCLVLASGSPRRLELLGQVVERFEVMVSGAEELIDTSQRLLKMCSPSLAPRPMPWRQAQAAV
ncbi:MAG: hypothetical protein R2855_12580 [Thermomicrobiales bacterium]